MKDDVLARIVTHKRWEVLAHKRLLSEREVRERVGIVPRPRDFAAALRRGTGPRIVAEFKRASPSKGAIAPGADVALVTSAYADGGAVALSVLTDTRFFGGCLPDLFRATESVSLPVLRKEFIVDAYQLYEARAWQADAVLLLCAVLDDAQLRDFVALAKELGMAAVVEAHDRDELARAARTDAPILGVNTRDLKTLATDPAFALAARREIPEGRVALYESSVRTAQDVKAAVAAGYDACLVGESLMTAADPAAAVRALRGK